MATIATLNIDISGNATGLNRTLEKTQGTVHTFTGMVKNAVGTMTGFIGADLLINGVSNAFAMAKDAVIGLNSNIEQTTTVFTGLMHSASRAKAFVQDLFDFAKKSPFTIQSVEAASLSLQKLGGNSLNTLKNLNLMGNAAAGLHVPMETVSEAVARFHAILDSGQPLQRAIRPMVLMGLIAPDVAHKIGLMSKAGASHAAIMQVLLSSFTGFNGAMNRQSGTWEGLTKIFQETVQVLAAKTFKPFFLLAEQGFKALNGLLVSKQFEAFAGTAAKALSGLVNGGIGALKTGLDTLKPYLPKLLKDFKEIWPEVEKLGNSFKNTLLPAIQALVPKPLLDLASALVGDIKTGLKFINDNGDAIKAIVLGIGTAWALWNVGLAFTKGLAMVEFLAQFIIQATIANGITDLWSASQWLLNAALTANPIGVIIVAIAALVAGVIWAYKNVGWFRFAVDAVWGALKAFASQFWTDVKPVFDFLGPVFGALAGAVGAFASQFWTDIKPVFDWLIPMLQSAWNWLGKLAQALGLAAPTATVGATNYVSAAHQKGGALSGRLAAGGPVNAYEAYLVGERGPEIFVPSGAGKIVPHGASGPQGTSSHTTNVYVTVQGHVTTERNLVLALREGIRRADKGRQ
jgi:hypothetical protein